MRDVIRKKFFGQFKPSTIFTYQEYMRISEENLSAAKIEEFDEIGLRYYEYSKINLVRSKRIHKTFKPKKEIIDLVMKVKEEQIWLIITEDWCGDSAQNLPYIIGYLKYNPLFKVYVILRDNNLSAIDNYFSNGSSRGIPKIIGFNEKGEELFVWGPRPKFAQDLVQQLKAEGYTKEEFNNELHLWYSRNRGKELEKELVTILKNINTKSTK